MYAHGIKHSDCIHGNMLQPEREAALQKFRTGEVTHLVATDVAARGIDVKDIHIVINYEFPMGVGSSGVEDYVHRIGRTGRAVSEHSHSPSRAHQHQLTLLLLHRSQCVGRDWEFLHFLWE
jgi:superfamily II DNA/RNA helicase